MVIYDSLKSQISQKNFHLTFHGWNKLQLISRSKKTNMKLYMGYSNMYTVFCRIHAPARTPKSPEGRLYSGVIISKSERCQAASGIPKFAVLFLMAGKSRVHAYSTR